MNIEIVPESPHPIFEIVPPNTTMDVHRGDWIAVGFKIPENADYNALYGMQICVDSMAFGESWCWFRVGFSKTLTKVYSQWAYYTEYEIDNNGADVCGPMGFISTNFLIQGADVPVKPGEQWYFILEIIPPYYFPYSCGVTIQTHVSECLDTQGVDTYTSYMNGNSIAGCWRVRLWGCIDELYTADFDYNPKEPIIGEWIQFTDLSTPEFLPKAWTWEFGDGGWSYDKDPQHLYGVAGQYTVNLTSTNFYGTDDTSTKQLTIYESEQEQGFPWWILGAIIVVGVIGTVALIKKR